ncbi:hypothetical protein BDV11DRAFT_199296 [Aspergillus similis]
MAQAALSNALFPCSCAVTKVKQISRRPTVKLSTHCPLMAGRACRYSVDIRDCFAASSQGMQAGLSQFTSTI